MLPFILRGALRKAYMWVLRGGKPPAPLLPHAAIRVYPLCGAQSPPLQIGRAGLKRHFIALFRAKPEIEHVR